MSARIVDFPPIRGVLPEEKLAAWTMIGVVTYAVAVMSPMFLAPAIGVSQEVLLQNYGPWMMGLIMVPIMGFMIYDSDPIRILRGKAPKPPNQRRGW